MLIFLLLQLLLNLRANECVGNCAFESFSKAKKFMENEVYFDHRESFYCGITYDAKKNILPNKTYKAKNPKSKRSKKIEWEHVVPAEAFGHNFIEWREGAPQCHSKKGKSFKGRNCARKVNKDFRRMEADPYNLVPAIGELNADRSNYSFAEIAGEAREYGDCDFEISDRKVEPRPQIKGDIARIYFYMQLTYPQTNLISHKNRQLFESWDKLDPVDEWECQRYQRIKSGSGLENPILSKSCSKK
jgi:deoxyribonuclease-1